MKTKGLKPKDRTLGKVANQWQNTAQQNEYMHNWLDINSPTFGNAYQSAIAAKYSDNYARQLSSIGLKWLTEYNRTSRLELQHLEQKLIGMINGTPNSKSPDDTKVKAIELLAKITGKLENQHSTTINLVQPILAGKSVVEQIDENKRVDYETEASRVIDVESDTQPSTPA